MELTEKEKRFIRDLKKATKNIPPRLWLFCSEGGLHVMAKDESGERVFTEYKGVDQDCVVETVTPHCVGGAW